MTDRRGSLIESIGRWHGCVLGQFNVALFQSWWSMETLRLVNTETSFDIRSILVRR